MTGETVMTGTTKKTVMTRMNDMTRMTGGFHLSIFRFIVQLGSISIHKHNVLH